MLSGINMRAKIQSIVQACKVKFDQWNKIRRMRNSVDQVQHTTWLLMELIHDRKSNFNLTKRSKTEITQVLDELHAINCKLRQRLRDETTK